MIICTVSPLSVLYTILGGLVHLTLLITIKRYPLMERISNRFYV
uniref:Uncharacterized protein n=1 Tax=Siphoviridae sp. ctRuT6 TaxID=2826339 RepID=A0A8S5N3H0_9CAUD|nr:MAG TPA: hypothetical protein [Siphoviridae sp. ctRuT6]